MRRYFAVSWTKLNIVKTAFYGIPRLLDLETVSFYTSEKSRWLDQWFLDTTWVQKISEAASETLVRHGGNFRGIHNLMHSSVVSVENVNFITKENPLELDNRFPR